MTIYKVYFKISMLGYDDGVMCTINIELDCDEEDVHFVAARIIAGIPTASFQYAEKQ